MSLSILPVSTPFPTSLVPENHTATDRQHAHDDANQHRHQHQHVEEPPSEEPATGSVDPESPPTRGTLIDVQA
jgi:hypothetical protein